MAYASISAVEIHAGGTADERPDGERVRRRGVQDEPGVGVGGSGRGSAGAEDGAQDEGVRGRMGRGGGAEATEELHRGVPRSVA